MGNFIGVYYSKISSGRLYIPKQLFSKIEDEKLIIKCGYDGYLKIFPLSKWKNILEQLHKFDPFNRNVDSFIRMYTYMAFEVDISLKQTILIPSFFREWAKIDKEIVIMGALDSFDIISKQRFEAEIINETNFKELTELNLPGSIIDFKEEIITEQININEQTKIAATFVNRMIFETIKNDPEYIEKLNPEKFEKWIAEQLQNIGFDVENTNVTVDDVVSVFAANTKGICRFLYIVKYNNKDKNYRIEVLRAFHENAELIVTTSCFSNTALKYQEQLKHRIKHEDFDILLRWIRQIEG